MNMEEDDQFTEADLQRMTYRQLQAKAKSEKLPSNVKKMYLIQILMAKRYESEEEVQRIVHLVQLERQQLASSKKRKASKKSSSARVQISEIIPSGEVHAIQPKVAIAQSSDRVLRSYNMRSTRRKPNYSFMNDSILGAVKLSENQRQPTNMKNKTQNNQSTSTSNYVSATLPNQDLHSYRRANQSEKQDRFYRDNQMVENPGHSRSYVRDNQMVENPGHSRSYVNRDLLVERQPLRRSYLKMETQPVLVNRNMDPSQPPPKRQRTVSGVQRMRQPLPMYECYQSISILRSDGQYSNIRGFVQRPQIYTESVLHSSAKNVSANVRQSVMKMKTCDSRKPTNTFQVKSSNTSNQVRKMVVPKYKTAEVTVQDIINCNIEKSQTFSNPNISEYVINKQTKIVRETDIRLKYPNLTAHIEGTESENVISQSTSHKSVTRQNVTSLSTADTQNVTGLNSSDLSQTSTLTVDSNLTEQNDSSPILDVTENSESCDYYHKKIRPDQVRCNTINEDEIEAPVEQVLPKIDCIFSQLKNRRPKDLTELLYVNVDENNVPAPSYLSSSTSMLETTLNFKRTLLVHTPFPELERLRKKAVTDVTYSYKIISSTMITPSRVVANASAEQKLAGFNQEAALPEQAKTLVPNQHKHEIQGSQLHPLGQSQVLEVPPSHVAVEGGATNLNGTQYTNVDENHSQTLNTGLLKPVYNTDSNNAGYYVPNTGKRISNDQIQSPYNDQYRQFTEIQIQHENVNFKHEIVALTSHQVRSIDNIVAGDSNNCYVPGPVQYNSGPIDGPQIKYPTEVGYLQFDDKMEVNGSQYVAQLDSKNISGYQNASNYSIDQSVYAAQDCSQYRHSEANLRSSIDDASLYTADDSQLVEPGSPNGSQYMEFDEASQTSPTSQASPDQDMLLINAPTKTETEATITELVEDALEFIAKDGNYMERIEMDVRMQCILCSWAGPKIILEQHIRKEHSDQIIKVDDNECNLAFCLGQVVNQETWLSTVIQCEAYLYALSVKYEDPERLMANLSLLTTTKEPQTGSITCYNKVTGEPYTWRGLIPQIYFNMPYETDFNCLTLKLSNLNLIPNRENVKLYNRALVNQSPSKVVLGSPELNDIQINMFVKLFY